MNLSKINRLLALLLSCASMCCNEKMIYKNATEGKSLLWEVSGNGLKQPSYFFGTMHLMCAEDAVLSKNLKSVISEVDQIYLEVDLDNVGELLSGALTLQMCDEITLANLLSPKEYHRVKSFFQQNQPNLPFETLERQQPLMLSSSLYELFLPCENKNGMDVRIVDYAAEQKKETKGLETIAFQAGLFDSIPYRQQANELVKTIDSIDKYRQLLNEMSAIYRSQDIERLHELTTKEEAGISSYADLLVYKRNKNWVQQFRGIAVDKPTLFAVGAGHLGGDHGVINLLKMQGYMLRPIEND